MKKTIVLVVMNTLCALSITTAFADDRPHPHWTYEGTTDAAHWGELEKDFVTCKLGKEQSPINIETTKATKSVLPAIDFHYVASNAEMTNNGHTIQINLPSGNNINNGNSNHIKLGKDAYHLAQFHFHTPSEEKINGKNYPLVAHLVHKNAEGKLAVVALLFKEGKENKVLKNIFDALPEKEGTVSKLANFNPAGMLPKNQTYYAFMGSLTTPPCSEGVRWQVLQQTEELSKKQIAAFHRLYKMNARPTQALNGRVVQVSE